MNPLAPPDSHHLSAATGWLELGNHYEANEALDTITPALRVHPDVLQVRYAIFVAVRKWSEALEVASALIERTPNCSTNWLHRAYALHRLGRTREALNGLLVLEASFPKDWMLRYNLAQYSCKLGNMKAAYDWLEKAIDLGDAKTVKLMALDDPELEGIWVDICEI